MADYLLPTPFGWPDDETGGTTAEDVQRILAAHYEPRMTSSGSMRGGIIRQAGSKNDGNGVELKNDATVTVHDGAVLLDVSLNRCVEAAVPGVYSLPLPLEVGTAGTVTIYVTVPQSGSNNAVLATTTSTAVSNNWVVLERLVFPKGWKTTSQATRNWDRTYAVLMGTSSGELSKSDDTDSSVRTNGNTYQKMRQSFVLATDSIVSLNLTSSIRTCDTQGQPLKADTGVAGSVFYRLYIDGTLHVTYERTIDPFLTTQLWTSSVTLSAGRHEVWVESTLGPVVGSDRTKVRWQVGAGGANKSRGDSLSVRHEGTSA